MEDASTDPPNASKAIWPPVAIPGQTLLSLGTEPDGGQRAPLYGPGTEHGAARPGGESRAKTSIASAPCRSIRGLWGLRRPATDNRHVHAISHRAGRISSI